MIYPDNFEQKTGFDKIRELITDKCLSTLGKERVSKMVFLNKYDEVTKLLHQTQEFVAVLNGKNEFPANYFFDVRPALKRIRVEGTYIDEVELFDLRRSLDTIRNIVKFFKTDEDDEKPLYPYLSELSGNVSVFPHLISRIDQMIDKFGRIKDNASSELSRIIVHSIGNIQKFK